MKNFVLFAGSRDVCADRGLWFSECSLNAEEERLFREVAGGVLPEHLREPQPGLTSSGDSCSELCETGAFRGLRLCICPGRCYVSV